MIDTERLKDLLDRPETARLVDALVRRLERGIAGGTLRLADPSEAERRAVEQLLGRAPGRGRVLSVPVDALEQVLQRGRLAPDLRSALVAMRGPLRDLAGERRRLAERWGVLFADLHRRPSAVPGWVEDLAASGLLKRLAEGDPEGARGLMGRALDVLERLPAPGLSLSRLAAETLGDAHGLDAGQPIGTLVRRALMLRQGPEVTESGEGDQELWAGAGVLLGGGITSLALVLNLPAGGATPTDLVLQIARTAGDPCYLTLRQLVRDQPCWDCAGAEIHVCENPALVAEAAARLGAGSAPLVCTRGQPSAAVGILLRQLAAAGARLRYHGDFDWPGIRITNTVIARYGAWPWRMSAEDYLAAPRTGKPLIGEPVEPAWAPGLAAAMRERGEAVEEECLVETLLGDLAVAGPPG